MSYIDGTLLCMKKLIILSLLFSSISISSALVCTDLKANLKRGAENSSVLALQKFLYEKKFLTATPNGYFGPGTQRAVQAYQKSVGLPNSGAVLAMTRAAIKKDSCIGSQTPSQSTSTQPVGQNTTKKPTVKTGPAPVIASLDKAAVILGGSTEWGIIIKGSNFSTTTNYVYLIRQDYSKRYALGEFPSVGGKTITLPKSLGTLTFPCGTNCRQKLQEGQYFVIVETESGGESQPNEYVLVKGSNIVSGSVSQSVIPYAATNTQLGVLLFKVDIPSKLSSIKFNFDQGNASSTKLTNIVFRDENTGKEIAPGLAMYEGEEKRFAVYANVENLKAIQAITSFTISITDAIEAKTTSFTTASTTLPFQAEPAAITESKRLAAIAPPEIAAIDRNYIFANGETAWSITVTGMNFSTTTNTVYMKARNGWKKYKIGVLSSSNGRTKITLPKSLGNTFFSCGNDCNEKLQPGDYDLTVETSFGESNSYPLTVHSFSIVTRSGTEYSAIEPKATNARLGTVSFATNASQASISSVSFTFTLFKNTSSVTGTTLKDDLTQQALVNAGKDTVLLPNDTKFISAYANVSTTAATGGNGYFTISIIEPVGKKVTTFTTEKFNVTMSAY